MSPLCFAFQLALEPGVWAVPAPRVSCQSVPATGTSPSAGTQRPVALPAGSLSTLGLVYCKIMPLVSEEAKLEKKSQRLTMKSKSLESLAGTGRFRKGRI